ncbi:Retrovirus-related Pol polyprotein [Stylophora pistillata]|uniref:Retrovirus-related Pol polyprotein n=1 Tax=Stylophora pistillata TaxID=50429 RepID=A0A2B4SQR4_STYPI|nr:Retrovirus-related Pol polyprotein [Stylophora pistillata]
MSLPRYKKQRPVPAPLEERLKQEIERIIQEQVIEEAAGASWISPVQIVYKGNGELRVCVDLREANKAVIRERFQIPRIQDLLRQLNGTRLLLTLDLRKAYWQVHLAEESREITLFRATGKVYQFKRLPFGLASAPEVYQRIMSIMCEGLSDKCALGMSELKFLGHIISAKGIKPDPDKVKAIADAPVPQNQAELRSFLGSITYLTQLVSNLATVITPLRNLTQKGVVWKWSTTKSKAFEEVKELLIIAPCLAHYSLKPNTKLVVDASPVGLGCVLLQNVDSRWQPISYATRSLTAAEKRYSQIEREAMAVLFGLQKMHSYIYGRHIALRCQDYDFTLAYEPGSENITDGLSRLSLNTTVMETSFVEEHVHFIKSADALLSIDEIKEAGESDPELLEVLKVLDGTQNLEKCALKLVGPFPGEIFIMTVVDYRSKWPEAIVLKRITTNGQVERFYRYLKHSIRAAELDGLSWTEVLPTILQAYRSTPHVGTDMTPAKLFLNRQITKKLSTLPEMDQKNPEERYKDIRGSYMYVIVHSKGPDTFELVNAETGQRLTRNVKFLSRVPRMELPVNDENEYSCLELEEFAGAAMPPLDQLGTTPSDDRTPADSGPTNSAMELRRSTRTPKPKRDADFVYDQNITKKKNIVVKSLCFLYV